MSPDLSEQNIYFFGIATHSVSTRSVYIKVIGRHGELESEEQGLLMAGGLAREVLRE